jgi:hypothetical protein
MGRNKCYYFQVEPDDDFLDGLREDNPESKI